MHQDCCRGSGAGMHKRLNVEQGKPAMVSCEREQLVREDQSWPWQVADGSVLVKKHL